MTVQSKRRILAVVVCCVAAVLFIVSCSDDDPVEPTSLQPNLKIDIDSTLTVSWNPELQVNKLYVERLDSDPTPDYGLVWFIADKNGLTPPITYAITPAGAQNLRPAMTFRPDAGYRVTLIRSDADGDHPVATAGVGVPPTVSRAGAESVVYAPEIVRLSPPGNVPEIWEFTALAIVPNAAWKDIPDEGEVEALLNVRMTVLRDLDRDDDGIQILLQYDDLRAADAPVSGGTTSIVWDQVTP